MIWFTSDHHFFHKNIIEYCQRPFKDLEEMHFELIHRWNMLVQREDTVYVLGDFIFGGNKHWQSIIPQLKGTIELVQGNHDDNCCKKYVQGVTTHGNMTAEPNGPGAKSYRFHLCHYPYPPEQPDEDDRFLQRRFKDDGEWLLHGHVHNAYKIKRKMINVGVDVWDYRPVALEQIIKIIAAQEGH